MSDSTPSTFTPLQYADSYSLHNDSLNIKLLVLGIGSVGKSSLLLRFTEQQWLPEGEMEPTIGVDTWEHKLDVRGKRVNLNIWDTAGDERLRALTTSYYRGTQGIILVYDVTNRDSFDAVSWWLSERSQHAPERAVKMIVGNKSDKPHLRQVSTSEGAAIASQNKCLFVESSAKTAVGVRETFRKVLEEVIDLPELPPSVTTKRTFHDLARILTT